MTVTHQEHELSHRTPPPQRSFHSQHLGQRHLPSSRQPLTQYKAATYRSEQLLQLKSPPHQTSLSNIHFLHSTAQAAPSSFNNSASGDPHSHASPALFAANKLLMQRVPYTEKQPHRRVICKLPPTLLPDVTALSIISYLT